MSRHQALRWFKPWPDTAVTEPNTAPTEWPQEVYDEAEHLREAAAAELATARSATKHPCNCASCISARRRP
jgi:hypothetical protein